MAFKNKNLSVLAYANGFTLWHYIAGEALASSSANGYFNTIASLMNTGDIVVINGSDTTGMRKVTATHPNVTVSAI